MGQYWMVVNLDKKEFVDPSKLGSGLKLWEQLANHPGTGAALVILCAAMPETRGGGDFDLDSNWHGPERVFPQHNTSPGPMPEDYQEIAKRTIGRWSGNRIALVGDYAEDGDIEGVEDVSKLYGYCGGESKEVYNSDPVGASYRIAVNAVQDGKPHPNRGKYVHYVEVEPSVFKDVTDDVCKVIEHELNGKFVGDGWREFKYDKASK